MCHALDKIMKATNISMKVINRINKNITIPMLMNPGL